MYKRFILSAALSFMLLAATPVSAAAMTEPSQQSEMVGKQYEVESSAVPSEEVNTIQESEMTRKMLQAEKARNAAENDKYGGAITIIAMGIVIAALVILSLLFLGFGKISQSMQKSRKRRAHGVDKNTSEEHHDELDSGEAIAAICMALAQHSGQGHDMEDTILTIRRMRKAYSPWNSKIYNLRTVPEHSPAQFHRKFK